LKGIKTRVDSLESIDEINGYFAADLMIEKVRDLVRQLGELDDAVKVDDIQSRLKTIREDAVRQLKDKRDLYADGGHIIKLGRKAFSVNVQALDLTLVQREGELCLHLTGTNFFEPLADPELNANRDLWEQEVVSENRGVYRAEYLAYEIFQSIKGERGASAPRYPQPARPSADQADPEQAAGARPLHESAGLRLPLAGDELIAFVQRFMAPRYSEGYLKGVHDHDAAKILGALLEIDATIGLLRFSPTARALAQIFWRHFGDESRKRAMAARLAGFGTLSRVFPDAAAQAGYVRDLGAMLSEFVAARGLFDEAHVGEAARYLFAELTREQRTAEPAFAVSRTAANLFDAFHAHLRHHGHVEEFARSVAAVSDDPVGRFGLLRDWVHAFLKEPGRGGREPGRGGPAGAARPGSLPARPGSVGDDADYGDELAALLEFEQLDPVRIVDATTVRELEGLAGTHPVIHEGRYRLHYNQFLERLEAYRQHVMPRYKRLVARKKELVEAAREDLRLEEFRPRVLTSFVRNKLLDTVYLPLIGDNLAKQIGESGEAKRTDRMGLLLLISPPGYGKTTLMEYIANRLGIIFMKINGPALGHAVTSLDPAAAPNASAREEIEKLNLALEMGDNVLIYLDDIQHTHPELLQKFISLCDATRRIEGVYKGKTRTYDFRGKKVAVVMAGNPYTESGEKFQIPDMLANRADVYNLGEIIGDAREAFEMSYLENCLTSNPVLNKLATRSQHDVYAVIKMAQRDTREGVDLEGNYSIEELNEMVAVMRKLMRIRDVVLTVNRKYIRSAAQADAYRTEPPFKLQGSYRNMNRMAERVLAVMNDAELETLILSSYENDAQTLTTGTEANLLKFKELLGKLTDKERERWEHIKRAYVQAAKLKGVGSDDKFGLAIAQLGTMGDGLDAIRKAVTDGVSRLAEHNGHEEPPLRLAPEVEQKASDLIGQLRDLRSGMDKIGEALAGNFGQLAELADHLSAARAATDREAAAEHARPPAIDRELVEGLAEDLRRISQAALAGDGRRPTSAAEPPGDAAEESTVSPAGPDQRITVVNKLPRTLMNVLERQFDLMQNWLKPLLEAESAQREELRTLRQTLESCLADYEALVGRLEKARGRKNR
ncbi:MAG: AAA family ATPase, partial [Planctomycetes bacterium]|nr:AAA family ATPase [Planctomycetota bacterium]